VTNTKVLDNSLAEMSSTAAPRVPAKPAGAATVDLSVVMVTWNALEVTSAALESIRKHAVGFTYEVFVIDNGTTKDATPTALPARFPWIRFITNLDNRGFTRANNQGIRQARGRYVVLLNNDTLQTENALGVAVQYLDARPDVGALGIMHRNNDAAKSFQASFFPFPRPAADVLGLWRRPAPAAPPVIQEQDVDWVCGSFLMMRRQCLDQVGPLDERYFIYAEDIDWCLQARRAGWKIRFWPGASMIHLGAQADPLMRDKKFVMFRSHVSYLRKNHGRCAAAAFYLAMVLRLKLALIAQIVRWPIGRGSAAGVAERWFRLRSFLTLRQGQVGG
jgi:GT2 family glycosyltransferase